MTPEVSVIMPAYNAGEFIAESIDSVIGQTFTNWELIIVDDGSTDNTASIAQQYQSSDPRVRYFHQQNSRQGKARNTGIKNSTGRYIAFLDADDLWTNDKLQLQVDILNARPEIDLVFSQGYFLMTDGSLQNSDVKVKEWNCEHDGDEFIDWNQIPILSAIVKKEALEDVGLFSEELSIQNAEDYHLWLKLLHKGHRFLSMPERLFYYRVHQSQITYQNSGMYAAIVNGYFDLVKKNILNPANKALQYRLKWMIINHVNPGKLYKKLKPVFSDKKGILFFYIILNRFLPGNSFTKRFGNRFL